MANSGEKTGLYSTGGKFLSFLLSQEQYGLEILKVVEIFGMMKITAVPRAPKYLKGVINLRGKIIPVMDLRLRFSLEERPYDNKTCIIVVTGERAEQELTVGLIVDTVLEVKDFPAEMISPSPDYGAGLDTDFIIGMGRDGDEQVTILLDLEKILPAEHIDIPVTSESSAAQ
ncbi:MAG: purine-binding chemotaxis protein CheW [Bdellovibrionales bacterium]|nr:purine-binding chemotaxis protein CheW [Bdellovibrionales bacterium]